MFSWFRRRRRTRLMAEGLSTEHEEHMDRLPFVARLPQEDRVRLHGLVRVFLEEKHFEGCNGLEMRDKIRVVIAAQACLLILCLDHVFYHKVKSILVYPSVFKHGFAHRDEHGVIENREHQNLGEAWPGGPIILAWDHAYQGGRNPNDGQNTVFHEFAHKLDMLDGLTDGIPPLTDAHEEDAWRERLLTAFHHFQADVEAGRKVFLDPYGATHPSEYFAVATEMFFERPRAMRAKAEESYVLLKMFYRQDPAALSE